MRHDTPPTRHQWLPATDVGSPRCISARARVSACHLVTPDLPSLVYKRESTATMTWLDDLTQHAKSRLDDRVLDALATRGVSDEQVTHFQIGHLDGLPEGIAYPEDFLKEVWRGSKLVDVYLFPLTNVLGEVKGFQFRQVERDRTGYLDYYADRSEAVLFGLAQAMPHIWERGEVLLVEGVFDLFPVQRAVPWTISTLTARVVEPLVPVLRRLVRRVWIGYDMDAPGRRGISSFKRDHGDTFEVHGLEWPTPLTSSGKRAKDPGDLWETWGDVQLGTTVRSLVGMDDK